MPVMSLRHGSTITFTPPAVNGRVANGLQIFPNLIGLIGLSGVVAAMLRGDKGGG